MHEELTVKLIDEIQVLSEHVAREAGDYKAYKMAYNNDDINGLRIFRHS